MRRRLTVPLLLALPLGVSACASLDSGQRQGFEVRGEYVAAVESAAKRRGVEVIWLNPPTRRRTRDIEWTTERTVELNRDLDN